MPSKTIRIDPDTYAELLRVKAQLELATGRTCSFSDAVGFLLALSNDAVSPVKASQRAMATRQ